MPQHEYLCSMTWEPKFFEDICNLFCLMKCLAKTRCKNIKMPRIDMHSCTCNEVLALYKNCTNILQTQNSSNWLNTHFASELLFCTRVSATFKPHEPYYRVMN